MSLSLRSVGHMATRLLAIGALWLGLALAVHADSGHDAAATTGVQPALVNPACASWGADRVDCFIVGNDGRMYHTWSDLASSGDARDFAPWFAEPGAPPAGFDPSVGLGVTAWAPGRLDIMAVTQDGSVAHRYYDGSVWRPTDWESLGRPAATKVRGIGCASWGINRIDCFTRGLDRRVYQVRWDGVSWGWFDMGPLPTGTVRDNSFLGVGAAAYASTSLFQLVISWDGDVYHRKWNGAAWSGWVNSGKPPTSTNLMSVSCQAGIIYVMDCAFLDFSGRAWHRSYSESESRWLDWHNLGPTGVRASNASGIGYSKVTGDYGAMYVMVYSMDGVVYLGFGRGSPSTFDWYGWSSLGRSKDQHVFLPFARR